MPEITVAHTRPEHAEAVSRIMCAAYGIPAELCNAESDTFEPHHIRQQLTRFPQGHFIALEGQNALGFAITMRTNYPPDQPPRAWIEMIGDFTLAKHDPLGAWLYGVEFAVHPDHRGRGIGVKLYAPRFALPKQLNLRGYYAVGMLMGYHRYRDQMSVRDYGEKVIRREISDPTVTMQMNRGFRPVQVVENYVDEPAAGSAGVLIVRENPDYDPKLTPSQTEE